MTTYYVDGSGAYMGGFEGNHGIDTSLWTEVASPPVSADENWSGVAWVISKDNLKDFLADYRWQKETGGIVWGGVPIRTDERSRSLLSGIQRKIVKEADDFHERRVKTVAGFQTLTNSQLESLYDAVADHIQKCFDIEDAIISLIDSGTLTTEDAVETEFDTQYAAP